MAVKKGEQVTHYVKTTEGVQLDEFADESQAKARCDAANADAEGMGIKTRYEVKPA